MTEADLVDALAAATIGRTFNFYANGDGAELRKARLRSYLAARAGARLLLVGEAAGSRGARVSGLAFTSERQLTGGDPAEASATIVHRVLDELGIAADTLLWNAVPTHPHAPGRPNSNRRPTREEVERARPFLAELARRRRVVPVGRVAADAIGAPGIRHPSHGGAREFETALRRIVRARRPERSFDGRGRGA